MGTKLESEKVVGDPGGLAGVSEHSHQVALMAAVAQYVASVPELEWLFAVPNGGSRGGDQRSAMIVGATLKAEGVKRGPSDLLLLVARHGYHGFCIEMKKPNGGIQSKEQIAFEGFVTRQGYLYAIFDHWADAFNALRWYLGFEHTRAWSAIRESQ